MARPGAARRRPAQQRAEGRRMSKGGHALAALGPETEQVVLEFLQKGGFGPVFTGALDERLSGLAKALEGWEDGPAARVLSRYLFEPAETAPDHAAVCQWVRAHPNEPRNVFECMAASPPERISITRVLSRVGSQKVVFLATWSLTQRSVVLKRLNGPPDVVREVQDRETQSHPLSLAHPNIIETYYMPNAAGEVFLVEEYLPVVLKDGWRCNGVQEAANLLFDIANALHYLHADLRWVHGDVKPDNIGKRGPDYILLDFGICRPIESFRFEPSATGSLRTRAPELLQADRYEYPTKADVWALGATVFNALLGRFPLFDPGEVPPPISSPDERTAFEAVIRLRIDREWDERVTLDKVPDPVRSILAGMLDRSPEGRWSCGRVLEAARHELAGFLRNQSDVRHISPCDELDQLLRFLAPTGTLRLMPMTEKDVLVQRLGALAALQGVPGDLREKADRIARELR